VLLFCHFQAWLGSSSLYRKSYGDIIDRTSLFLAALDLYLYHQVKSIFTFEFAFQLQEPKNRKTRLPFTLNAFVALLDEKTKIYVNDCILGANHITKV